MTKKKLKKFYRKLGKRQILILDPLTTYISPEAEIEASVTIHPGAIIVGKSKINSFAIIKANVVIKNSVIGKTTVVKEGCIIENSITGNYCDIGPIARLKNGTIIKSGAHIESFVEIENSIIGPHTKIGQNVYIGDAKIGQNVSIGAGTKIANQDGKKRNETIIQDKVYIGVNVSLVAPIKIGKGAYISAGSTITEDVPHNNLSFARAKQTNQPHQSKKNHKQKNDP